MEEADASLRKRPRLDNGERSLFNRSASADPLTAASSVGPSPNSASLAQGSANPNLSSMSTQPPRSDKDNPDKPTLHRSSSKVTINTKSSNISMSNGVTADSQPSLPDIQNEPLRPQLIHEADQSSQEAIAENMVGEAIVPTPVSGSSSPSRSPEIEVAEVEDMDQDPADSVWSSSRQENPVLTFPWVLVQGNDISRHMDHVRRALHGEPLITFYVLLVLRSN
jgi:ubiquitin carboxyl-terminal hydrolase 34